MMACGLLSPPVLMVIVLMQLMLGMSEGLSNCCRDIAPSTDSPPECFPF